MMMKQNQRERGSALMLVTIISLILVGISGAYLSISWWNTKRSNQDEAAAQAMYIAESGAAQYIVGLNASGGGGAPTPKAATGMGGGFYWVPAENIVDFSQTAVVGASNLDKDYASFQVAARYNGVTRRVTVLMTHKAGGVFWNAIFAGNTNLDTKFSDPNYSLNLAGVLANGTQDIIKGDIYTQNNLNVSGDAQLTGNATFGGTNNGYTGSNYTAGTEPSPQILRNQGPSSNMTLYENNAKNVYPYPAADPSGNKWIDVNGQFNTPGVATPGHKGPDGTLATDILNPNNPAHFLRRNPSSQSGASNRTAAYEITDDTTTIGPTGNKRNDFYIEDPIKLDGTANSVTAPSLTGVAVNGDTTAGMVNIGTQSNNAVYYIEGNLRVSGEPVKSYQFNPGPGVGDIKMTFVVKGNASFTDNLLYPNWESQKDAVAIIALKDPEYPNVTGADFAPGSGATSLTKNGVSIDAFVKDFNAKAAASNGNITQLNLSLPADQERAAMAYNKVYGSGNVYFGDPGSGTVEHMEAFMFAENNFYATNLDSTNGSGGTKEIEIYGNMTAGNQVLMARDTTKVGYSRVPLHVTFDPLIKNGGNPPPGLPPTPGVAGQDWRIVSWKQSTNTAEANSLNEKDP